MESTWKRLARPLRQQVVRPLVSRASQLALGYDLTRIGPQLQELQAKLKLTVEPHRLWLYENRLERMDATVDIFDAQRRAFHLARYQFACGFVQDRVVADIACGTGYGSEWLAERGRARRVLGIDIDPAAVAYANERHRPANVEFVCAAGQSCGLRSRSVDVVVSFETIEHVPDDRLLLAEFHRILRPGGWLVISTPNDWPAAAGPCHERSYTVAQLRAVLEARFEIRELHNQNSGSSSLLNHGQPAGMIPTTADNAVLAECLVAVCRARSWAGSTIKE